MSVNGQHEGTHQIFESFPLFGPSASRESNPRLNTLKQGLRVGLSCVCLLLREVRLASVNVNDLRGSIDAGLDPSSAEIA